MQPVEPAPAPGGVAQAVSQTIEQAKALLRRYLDWAEQRAAAKQEREHAIMAATGNQVMRQYIGEKAMRNAILSMQNQGYRVSSQSSYQPRSGCMRVILLGGIGALIWKPKPVFVLTYVRD